MVGTCRVVICPVPLPSFTSLSVFRTHRAAIGFARCSCIDWKTGCAKLVLNIKYILLGWYRLLIPSRLLFLLGLWVFMDYVSLDQVAVRESLFEDQLGSNTATHQFLFIHFSAFGCSELGTIITLLHVLPCNSFATEGSRECPVPRFRCHAPSACQFQGLQCNHTRR